MSEVSELKETIRKLRSQLRNEKKKVIRLSKNNKQLLESFRDSIKHIDENLDGKSLERILKDLREE